MSLFKGIKPKKETIKSFVFFNEIYPALFNLFKSKALELNKSVNLFNLKSDLELNEFKNRLYLNLVNLPSSEQRYSSWVSLMRSSYRGKRVGYMKPYYNLKAKKKIFLNNSCLSWYNLHILKFLPFTFNCFKNKIEFEFNNLIYKCVKTKGKNLFYMIFDKSKNLLFKWPPYDNRRRRQLPYDAFGFSSVKPFKLHLRRHIIPFGLKMSNNVKFAYIDRFNLRSRISEFVYRELIIIFLFWFIYYLSTFSFFYLKTLYIFVFYLFILY